MQNTICNPADSPARLKISHLWQIALLIIAWLCVSLPAYSQETRPPDANRVAEDTLVHAGAATPPAKGNVTEILIDSSLPDDPAILKLLEPYRSKVRELDVVIGRLTSDLRKGGMGAGSLGNFVTDGLRAEASRKLGRPVLLSITNKGGLRKNAIAAGELRVRDIFELLPFENSLVKIDLTGVQLLKLLKAVLASGDAQSGARITYRLSENNEPELIKATLVDERGKEISINPRATYSVVTVDYLYSLQSGPYAVLREGSNVTRLGITLRDGLLQYVKAQTAAGRPVREKLDGRFRQIGEPKSRAAFLW